MDCPKISLGYVRFMSKPYSIYTHIRIFCGPSHKITFPLRLRMHSPQHVEDSSVLAVCNTWSRTRGRLQILVVTCMSVAAPHSRCQCGLLAFFVVALYGGLFAGFLKIVDRPMK